MRRPALILALSCTALLAVTPEEEVKHVLEVQTSAWNKADLPGFVKYYSPDSVFVGKRVQRGTAEILESYKRSFSTPAKMGKLTFTDLEVRMLGPDYASMIGRFHLARTAEGGGNSEGIFNLIFRKYPDGWKIILDHTS